MEETAAAEAGRSGKEARLKVEKLGTHEKLISQDVVDIAAMVVVDFVVVVVVVALDVVVVVIVVVVVVAELILQSLHVLMKQLLKQEQPILYDLSLRCNSLKTMRQHFDPF